jgi:predicted RND superfamily exporter protein
MIDARDFIYQQGETQIRPVEPGHHSPSLTSRIAGWSARHRKTVGVAWAVAVVISLVAAQAVPADTDIQLNAPGESGDAFDLFKQRFRIEEEAPQEIVVFRHPTRTVEDPEYQQMVQDVTQELVRLRVTREDRLSSVPVTTSSVVVSGTTSHYDTGLEREQSPFVATREGAGDVTFAIVELEDEFGDALEGVEDVVETVHEAQDKNPENN